VNDIAKGYYNLLLLRSQISIAAENVALTDSTLRIIRLQYASGKTTSLAVQQAEAQHLDAAALLPQFHQQLAIQENALRILSGQWPDSVETNTLLEAETLPAKLDAGIPASLLARRPDVRLSEQALQQANANVGYAKASLYPSLTITAQGGLDAIKASNWFNIPSSLFGAVAGSLTQPLFQQNALRTQLAIAKVRREEAVIVFRQSVLVAAGEVADELIKLDQLQQRQAIVSTRVQTLELATQNARLLFGNGMATYLEVLTAQGSVLQSKLELATLRKTQLDASVDLYRAVGGGWH
jgi:NodT family efflux transporter outer membrane factor (OMF) lipoprotein